MVSARAVRERHESELLALPNVVGVAAGQDEPTGDEFVLVLVTHKVPASALPADEVVPTILDGIPVRVQAVGEVTAEDPQ